MTVINNIEIDNVFYKPNEIKETIMNNDPIEEKLHVVIVISNPCLYARRYILIKEFIKRMEMDESNVLLYVVELVYKNQKFIITDADNKRHLQLKTETSPIWHKENMINLGIQKLLPPTWKAVAWIDSDLEFESTSWATDTLKVLNGSKDIVQLFSHCVDMNINGETMLIASSFCNQYVKKIPYISNSNKTIDFWHPGYAWACTRKAYDKMGGLFEHAILGSGDNVIALCLIGNGIKSINSGSTEDYKKHVLDYQNRIKNFRIGYVPGVMRHHFHGSKKNRKYTDRWRILLNHGYEPSKHLTKDEQGLLIPSKECPTEMLDQIYKYFQERNEDEFFHSRIRGIHTKN